MENSNEKRINIYCILGDIARGLKFAVAVGIALALLSYVFVNITYTPEYTSSTTFIVSSKTNFSGPLQDSARLEEMTDTFQAVINSSVLKNMVCEDLGYDNFPGTVGMSVLEGTNLLTMSVTANDPNTAFRALDSLMECYPKVGDKVLGEVVMEIYEEPRFPESPNNIIDGFGTVKRGFTFGFGAVIIVLALISYLKNTVKEKEDIVEKLDTTEIATLFHENKYRDFKHFLEKKPKKIIFTDANVSFGYGETIKKIRTKIIYQMKKRGVKVVYIASTLDGEGKTTIAFNLAEAMAKKYNNVLLIEGDSKKCELASKLGIEVDNQLDWGRGFKGNRNLKDYIVPAGKHKFKAMVNMAVDTFSSDDLASNKMVDFLKEVGDDMDIVIIDGPPAYERSDAELWAKISDVSILIVKQNYAEVKYINDTIDILNDYGDGLLGCIFNDVFSTGEVLSSGYGYGNYGGYGSYGGYGRYGKYGNYGKYGAYGAYAKNSEKGEDYES